MKAFARRNVSGENQREAGRAAIERFASGSHDCAGGWDAGEDFADENTAGGGRPNPCMR